MVRRAKVPRDSNNRIMYGGFSCRELSGWPDGISYSPRRRKSRKPRKKEEKPKEESVDPSTLPQFVPEPVKFGIPL